jgi:DNA-binding LacI/PurR family transcriptional regulator
VLINNHNEGRGRYTYSVSVDNPHGGHLATDHLLQLGHRRIAYVSGSADHSDDLDRLAGYRQALDRAGTPFETSLVVPGTGRADGGERALPILMALEAPPTAVLCYNDMTAIGLMRAAAAAGLSIALPPLSYGSHPYHHRVCPALSRYGRTSPGNC